MLNQFFVQYGGVIYLIQFFFAVVIGVYFWTLLKGQQSKKNVVVKESERETQRLQRLRTNCLTEPLSSLTRPASLNDVIGQEEAIDILRSALCGPNPQHVILYGPPGVGKTAAARLVLDEAQKNSLSPFNKTAKFIEVDATITRFDERNIADPLIGSVHDPIYQGAGALGQAGIPQPKPGACTKAHGGILFIDEIGELHPLQMNKLLKVLEDRKVLLESAYYSESDRNIPSHIHDIFNNGLPADFRLVGATTRSPDELSPALRSRCMEVFFKPLEKSDILTITKNAADKINCVLEEEALDEISRYASNGREAVNMVQLAAGIAMMENSPQIGVNHVEKVLNNGRFTPRAEFRPKDSPAVGIVNGLAVFGACQGTLIEVEAKSIKVEVGKGNWTITGVVEEEQFGGQERRLTRKSMAKGALETVFTVLRSRYGINLYNYDIHINFPGGVPVDGPSAGVSMAAAIYSSIKGLAVDNLVAMTGELSVHGSVKPVGGVISKVEAARKAGIKRVLIPAENWLKIFDDFPEIKIIPVQDVEEVISQALEEETDIITRAI
jgi:Lon-like ATP-dependent protease